MNNFFYPENQTGKLQTRNKIFYLMGKSATGKSAIYERLLQDPALRLQPVILYTTRPIRVGERDGITYHFRDLAFFKAHETDSMMIECRIYQTRLGPWYYFTMDDGQIDLESSSHLMIGTLESYEKMRAHFGEQTIVPLYLEVEDAERLRRALEREKGQNEPRMDEVCRRYLADEVDFSEEKLIQAGIRKRFVNEDMEVCLKEIREYCAGILGGVNDNLESVCI